jgi:polysaccharide export outer membrane protein
MQETGPLKKLAILALVGAMVAPAAATAQDGYYQIQAGDALNVQVLEDPNLSSQVLVRPDGRISLPIAGSVMAEGRSPEQLEAVLRSRFAAGFELSPTVTVSVARIAPKDPAAVDEDQVILTYYLLGQVARPGPISVDEPLTLLQALSLAGGPGPFANAKKIQIRRRDDAGVEELMTFDFSQIEDGLPVTDIELLDDDVIFIPERGLF